MAAIHIAASLGAFEIISVLATANNSPINITTSDGTESTALHICAKNGYFECVRRLLQHGASIEMLNKSKQYPIHLAAMNKQFTICQMLTAQAEGLSIPIQITTPDHLNKSPLNYCNFEEGFIMKLATTQYYDVTVIFSDAQLSLAEKLIQSLNNKKIKCWYDKSRTKKAEDIYPIIRASRGVLFFVGSTTVIPDSLERNLLMFAKENKKHLFPIWQEKLTLEPDVEAIIFRFQLVDFTDPEHYLASSNTLAAAIKAKLMQPDVAIEEKESKDNKDDVNNDISSTLSSQGTSFDQQIIFFVYDPVDAQVAKTIVSLFELYNEIQIFDATSCKDSAISSNTAKHCFAVLLLVSNSSLSSSFIRDQISVAENNKKPIYGVQLDKK